jgi:hypothetical protein
VRLVSQEADDEQNEKKQVERIRELVLVVEWPRI